jgi:hypothetical protein
MAEQSLWQRVVSTINREYERRIRRASLVSEYGADHHGHHHAEHAEHTASHTSEDEEAAEIVNVPKGTRLARRPSAETTEEHEAPSAQA